MSPSGGRITGRDAAEHVVAGEQQSALRTQQIANAIRRVARREDGGERHIPEASGLAVARQLVGPEGIVLPPIAGAAARPISRAPAFAARAARQAANDRDACA